MTHPILTRQIACLFAIVLATVAGAGADEPSSPAPLSMPPDLNRPPVIPLRMLSTPVIDPPSQGPNRIRVFRMQPGFLSDVPWLTDEDQTAGGAKLPDPEPDPDFFNLSYGNDNPLFDFRTRGDPGGVGFARVNSQLQLFDTSKTAMSLGLVAVTPLGLAYDGLADNRGTTVVTPGLSVFHELGDGVGVQASVSKNMPLENQAAQVIRRDVQYGVALHRPVTTDKQDPLSALYLSIGALGQTRVDPDGGRTLNWDVMPGMHLRLADNWWLSSGVLLPVGPNRSETGGHWRLTCQWQF